MHHTVSGKPGELRQDTDDTYLLKTHVFCILTEALAADVQAVLPDDAPLVSADTAARQQHSSEDT